MIKKLCKSIREYKKDTILTPICVSVEVILEVLITYFMATLVDKGIEASNMSMILRIGFILSVMAILSLIFGVLSGNYCARATAGFAKNLRKDIFYKIQNFSFFNIDKFKTSGLITRLTTDIQHVSMAFQTIIRITVRAPLMIIFAFIMITQINTKISLIFLGIMPLFLIGLIFIAKKVHPLFREAFDEYDNLNNVVSENLNGIRVVKSYIAEDREVKKFNKVSYRIYKLFRKAQTILAFNGPIMQVAVYTTMLLVSWIGAKLIVSDSMTTGQLLSLFTYIMQVMNSLMMVSMIFVIMVISKESCERICEVLDEDVDLKNNEIALNKVKDGSIKFKDVSFSYAKKTKKECLKNINLEIKSGETVGIIGGTGSGKSSLVQLIPRLYDVTEGHVYVANTDVKDYDLFTLRENVAMVLQKNVLFKGTILDNLRWGNPDATKEEAMEACKMACIWDFVESLDDGLDYFIEQGGTNVSGGQKQRLCIARALLKKPKILILDDSTSAVDTKTDANIRKAFLDYIPETTKIIIAQRINSVMDCDKIIVMDNGEINGIGTHLELLKKNKIYQEVYKSQNGGGLSE